MIEEHRHALLAHSQEIAEDLNVDDVLTSLQSKLVLNSNDVELIRAEKTSQLRVQKLLAILPNKGFEAFGYFLGSLEEKYPHLQTLLNVQTTRQAEGNYLAVTDAPVAARVLGVEVMKPEHKEMLLLSRKEIVEDLMVEDVQNYLQQVFVLDTSDVELIHAEKTSYRQSEKLLDIIVTRGDSAFYHFRDSLRDCYPHLAELLENEVLTRVRNFSDAYELQARVESVLLEGGVPQRPSIYANRSHDLHRLRTALRSLEKRDGWVLLHGMAGCGKTVLAAEALRSASLLEQCFPGGVFWTRIGPVDSSKLLMKMTNLCALLESGHVDVPPRNIEEARDRLRLLFIKKHPRSLLILDDVWSPSDVKYFDVRCRTLVTTRDASVANYMSGPKVKVHLSEGFPMDQAKQVLAKWTNQEVESLPPESDKIILQCNGSPLVISMIGAMLREHPKRWKYYLTQLEKRKTSRLKTTFSYQYPTLTEAMLMSLNNLSDELRTVYEDFVVFDAGVRIPPSVLSLFWNEEPELVEDWMDELANKSLAKVHSTSMGQDISYSIHNLQIVFLQELTKDVPERHARLVQRYQKKCKGKFHVLEDDSYIHLYLVHHMIQAEMVNKAFELLTDLRWVTAKLKITGPADLLHDYIMLSENMKENSNDSENLRKLEEFKHFVSVNANLFVEKTFPDIVQLALMEPVQTDVYRQGRAEVTRLVKEEKRFFVDWCNKPAEGHEQSLMTIKVHQGAVTCCQYTCDGMLLFTCGSDHFVKVWEVKNGKQIWSVEGHKDTVSCCNLSHDEKRIVTSSWDGTAKIWQAVDGRLLVTFPHHRQEVYSCAFSCNDKNVASCAADKKIRVWDSHSGKELFSCDGHTDTVRCCCYSPQGDQIASASDDMTVKIWDSTNGQELLSCFTGRSACTFCCFSSDGTEIWGSGDNYVQSWSTTSGTVQKSLVLVSTVLSMALSPDGQLLAVALSDTTVQLWDLSSEQCMSVYKGHTGWVYCVIFSPDGANLASGSIDQTVKLWEVDKSQAGKACVKLCKVFDAVFLDDQIVVAVADHLHKIQIFEGEKSVSKGESISFDAAITCCVLCPASGELLCVATESGKLAILNRNNLQVKSETEGHSHGVLWCVFSQDSNFLLSGSVDKTLKLWNVSDGTLARSFVGHRDKVTKCLFFHTKQLVLSSSADGTLKVWNISSGEVEFFCYHSNKESILTCDVSIDDQLLVSASTDTKAKVWSGVSGDLLHVLSSHIDCVRSVAFSSSTKYLTTGCDDGTLKVWDPSTGAELATCNKHEAWVTDCHFLSEDMIVSAADNLIWWKLDGTLVQIFRTTGSSLQSVSCSQDFKQFVTVDSAGHLYIIKVIV